MLKRLRGFCRTCYRAALLAALAPWATVTPYRYPELVGWSASVHVPFFGAVGFVRGGKLNLSWGR
jgi:hypothetical protein